MAHSTTEISRTVTIDGEGPYRLRACEVEPGVVLVSAAPLADVEGTVRRLVAVQVVAFALALLVLVVIGRKMLRRGLRPLSDMATTAHGITSHDLTDSAARLPLRAERGDGGPEVEELRTAFNTMLEHIDDSLAVRAEAEQRLRRFVADASHELRTPLMSVRGYADLFQYAAANVPEERDRHLARLRAEAARMGVLLDDLLLLARLDAADVETPLRPEDADLAELVEQAADAFRAGHPDHPLTVEVGERPVRLRVDPVRIRQVLDNLLANAAVHTPAGTAVSVTLAVAGGMASVRVADAGPGIPEDDRARVFDRFYRVDKARTRDRGGSGLGLAVARSLAKAHGGSVELTSEPGATVFTVTIPLGPRRPGERGWRAVARSGSLKGLCLPWVTCRHLRLRTINWLCFIGSCRASKPRGRRHIPRHTLSYAASSTVFRCRTASSSVTASWTTAMTVSSDSSATFAESSSDTSPIPAAAASCARTGSPSDQRSAARLRAGESTRAVFPVRTGIQRPRCRATSPSASSAAR